MAISWANIPNNQVITFENLSDACYYGYFLELLPMPPQGVSPKKCIRAELIQSYVEIEPGPLEGTPPNQTVIKEKIVGKQYVYYKLQVCEGPGSTEVPPVAYTRLTPTLGTGHRYIIPSSFPFIYCTYMGPSYDTPLQINIPPGYNPNIQRTEQTGCPS